MTFKKESSNFKNMNNKYIRFLHDETDKMAALLASLQYHGVKFSIDRDGTNYLITIG